MRIIILMLLVISCAKTDKLCCPMTKFYKDQCGQHIKDNDVLQSQLREWDQIFYLIIQYNNGDLNYKTVYEILHVKSFTRNVQEIGFKRDLTLLLKAPIKEE